MDPIELHLLNTDNVVAALSFSNVTVSFLKYSTVEWVAEGKVHWRG